MSEPRAKNSLKRELVESLGALEHVGFKRRGLRWEAEATEPLRSVCVELQRSNWGEAYFINLVVYPIEHTAKCPIMHRVPSDTLVGGHPLGELLDESGPEQRQPLLRGFVERVLAPLARRTLDVDGLREAVREGTWGIEPEVRRRLGLLPAAE